MPSILLSLLHFIDYNILHKVKPRQGILTNEFALITEHIISEIQLID